MTSRADGAAEDAAAVMHLDLLTPARRPDPRSSDVRLHAYSNDPNRNIASEANQKTKIILVTRPHVCESRDRVMCVTTHNEMNN